MADNIDQMWEELLEEYWKARNAGLVPVRLGEIVEAGKDAFRKAMATQNAKKAKPSGSAPKYQGEVEVRKSRYSPYDEGAPKLPRIKLNTPSPLKPLEDQSFAYDYRTSLWRIARRELVRHIMYNRPDFEVGNQARPKFPRVRVNLPSVPLKAHKEPFPTLELELGINRLPLVLNHSVAKLEGLKLDISPLSRSTAPKVSIPSYESPKLELGTNTLDLYKGGSKVKLEGLNVKLDGVVNKIDVPSAPDYDFNPTIKRHKLSDARKSNYRYKRDLKPLDLPKRGYKGIKLSTTQYKEVKMDFKLKRLNKVKHQAKPRLKQVKFKLTKIDPISLPTVKRGYEFTIDDLKFPRPIRRKRANWGGKSRTIVAPDFAKAWAYIKRSINALTVGKIDPLPLMTNRDLVGPLRRMASHLYQHHIVQPVEVAEHVADLAMESAYREIVKQEFSEQWDAKTENQQKAFKKQFGYSPDNNVEQFIDYMVENVYYGQYVQSAPLVVDDDQESFLLYCLHMIECLIRAIKNASKDVSEHEGRQWEEYQEEELRRQHNRASTNAKILTSEDIEALHDADLSYMNPNF